MKKEERPIERDMRFIDDGDEYPPFEVIEQDQGTPEFQEAYENFAVDMIGEPLCMSCVHSHNDGTCKAFPNRIPLVILSGEVNHFLPYEGDNGIQYEPKETE